MAELRIGTVRANDVGFTYLSAGPDDPARPLALLLHGFPDSPHTWRHLMPRLAERGYRAVAPYLRGFAPTEVPLDDCYQTGALAVDANSLHDALAGDERAVIIGHDWGAVCAHGAAVLEPDRWRTLVTMAVPPGQAVPHALVTSADQLQMSWYMFFFQHPLAELVVPADDMAFIDRLWAQWSPGYDASDDLPAAKATVREAANLRAALGYYRAALGAGHSDARYDGAQAVVHAIAAQPALYLHGRDDGCIDVEVAEAVRSTVPSSVTIEIVDNAGHFLHLEQPARVNDRIIDFLG